MYACVVVCVCVCVCFFSNNCWYLFSLPLPLSLYMARLTKQRLTSRFNQPTNHRQPRKMTHFDVDGRTIMNGSMMFWVLFFWLMFWVLYWTQLSYKSFYFLSLLRNSLDLLKKLFKWLLCHLPLASLSFYKSMNFNVEQKDKNCIPCEINKS